MKVRFTLRFLVLGIVAFTVAACSDSKKTSFDLLPAKRANEDGETERMRKMELVTVIDQSSGSPEQTDVKPSELEEMIRQTCLASSNSPSGSPCGATDFANFQLCKAKTYLALTRPQATSVKLTETVDNTTKTFVVPLQNEATNAALAEFGRQFAALAGKVYYQGLISMMGGQTNCGAVGSQYGDTTLGVFYASAFADAFGTYNQLSEAAAAASVNTSDAELNSSSSVAEASKRAIDWRLKAAREMGGSATTLPLADNGGFCSRPPTTPDVRAAIAIFRDAAPSPVDILADATSTQLLLDGTLPNGSVRERLAQFYGSDKLKNGGPSAVEQLYNLNLTAFEDARASLKEEIVAFSRSMTAKLAKRTLPDGTQATYDTYAGVAARPSRLPSAFYGALARQGGGTSAVSLDGSFDDPNLDGTADYNSTYLAFLSAAQQLLANGAALPATRPTMTTASLREATLGPLGMMASDGALVANIFSTATAVGSETIHVVYVSGFSFNDGLRLAVGEDQLRCAVQGSIEGADCTPDLLPFNPYSPGAGDVGTGSAFNAITYSGLSINKPTRVYVLKPRLPPSDPNHPYTLPAVRGGYEALGGLTLQMDQGTGFVVVKGNEDRVAAMLEPSRDWCAHPHTTCDGSSFDDRIPLENELTDNTDGIEDSWKHYLLLAQEAAQQADLLGTDYINSSLSNAQNVASNEDRKQQQLEQANGFLQQLQTVCGIQTDTSTLVAKLTDALGNVVSTGGTCTNDDGCDPGFHCVKSAGNGICSLDLLGFLIHHSRQLGSGADIQRLLDCTGLVSTNLVPFVSLGDQALCLWRKSNDPNLVCKKADGTNASPGQCPRPLPPPVLNQDGSTKSTPTCDDAFAGSSEKPVDATAQVTVPLNYFSMKGDPTNAGEDVDLYALARTLSPDTWTNAVDPSDPSKGDVRTKIISKNILDVYRLTPVINAIDWESRADGFGAITFQGQTLYETGSITAGPSSGKWPCGTDLDRPWLANVAGWIHPRSYTCGPHGNAEANAEMFAAVAAVKLLPHTPPLVNELDGSGIRLSFPMLEHVASDDHCLCATTNSRAAVRPDQSGFIVNSCSGGTGYFDGNGGEFACLRPDDVHAPTEESAGMGVFPFFDAFEGMYENSKTRTAPASWILNYLSGIGHLSDKLETVKWDSDLTIVPGANGNSITLRGGDIMMAMGLIAKAAGRPPTIRLDQPPPKITSVDQLSFVAQYIQNVAEQIRDTNGSIVFANVPQAVMDALRSESENGSYPQFGGDMAVQISNARGALLRIHQNGPLIANEVTQVASDIDSLRILLQKSTIKKQIDHLQFLSTLSDRLTQCATAITGAMAQTAGSGFAAGAVAGPAAAGAYFTCANSITQIGIAKDLASLQGQDADLDGELAMADFDGKFSTHATAMQTLGSNLAQAEEDLDAALATIETKRDQARSLLASAISAASFQAQHQAEVTAVIGNLAEGKQVRYTAALHNARHLANLAKRAIEQRLGVSLAAITDDYPLVEAPSKWESTVCDFTGLDYAKLAQATPDAPKSFANGFIGDYVTKLSNFVESYTLQNNFHEGTDTAIISLRDDVMGVRKSCEVAGPNLLFNAGQLDQGLSPGWGRENCLTQTVNGVVQPVPDCADFTRTENDNPAFADPSTAHTGGYLLSFGAGATSASAAIQSLDLQGGLYRFSWYTKEVGTTSGGAGSGIVEVKGTPTVSCANATGVCEVVQNDVEPSLTAATWHRRYILFRLNSEQIVNVGFGKPASGANTISLSGPMLEKLKDVSQDQALTPFVNTADTLNEVQPVCVDSDGSLFRSTRWNRSCVKLCADGFADNCASNNSKDYCYWETQFGFSQRDIQAGKVFNFSGFARGNFNYRIDSVGINFVGTGTKNCGTSDFPQTCFGSGSIPYTLSHAGPFYVRNFKGDDVETKIFDGNIEHARGLAAERYLTNPLSDSDNSLIKQYLRSEFSGRPLDGNFVLRVWEDDGVDFTALQDVQLVLNYRYWTKFN